MAVGFDLRQVTQRTNIGFFSGSPNVAGERALRAVALGRKNCLFGGPDAGRERAATMYSLIGTAKLNGGSTDQLRASVEELRNLPVPGT
jgi:transposase